MTTEQITDRTDDRLMPLSRCLEDVDVDPTTLRHWVTTGVLPAVKLRQRWYVRPSDWQKFISGGS